MALKPFEWKDRPALIEHLFPVQKISAESYKEQMAVQSKALVALGSYWKGRKPLILNRACILGSLLPTTDNLLLDLKIFELLMAMDEVSMKKRIKANLPASKQDLVNMYLSGSYNEAVRIAKRPDELDSGEYSHIWTDINKHLGTQSFSISELVNEIGIARFGHRPQIADVFAGSGQIPFEAARLGCEVYASDLNPIACLLTWGSFHIVGANQSELVEIKNAQNEVISKVQRIIDSIKIDENEIGSKAKAYLYCVEVKCPETGWMVPVLPTLIVSASKFITVELLPNESEKCYDIAVRYWKNKEEMVAHSRGTIERGYLTHSPDGVGKIRVKISSLRETCDANAGLRLWSKEEFLPSTGDVFHERLYCIQWVLHDGTTAFSAVTEMDMKREAIVEEYLKNHLSEWQREGFIPDMKIERGYNTDQPIRERGWTYWHHLFCPRQLLMLGIVNQCIRESQNKREALTVFFARMLDWSSKMCYYGTGASRESIAHTFYNQALNTFYNYGVRPFSFASKYLIDGTYNFPVKTTTHVKSHPADEVEKVNDIYITDPPYGDAVKYEEITEYFIAWLRKNPPPEFSSWTWDSRRALAIKGEDEGFRQLMVAAYRKTAEKMPDNGIQVLMFTHQSGSIWADMANIVWASGLQVTAAWYVVTETDSALRDGAYVKGTIMLVLRKRHQRLETFRDDLGWEIESAVKEQVEALVGLDKKVREQRSEGLYNDADLQMAGYAAALKVLTAYAVIDGKDMVIEAEAPRQKGKISFVDQMIDFAVQTAVQFLVPIGFEKSEWQAMSSVERYYLKMVELEHQGQKTLDNYQNFAKAFKVHHFEQLISDASKANSARLKLSLEFKTSMMSGDAEIAGTPLRALLFSIYEISKEIEVEDALLHLMENCPNYLQHKPLLVKVANYLAEKRDTLKPGKNFYPDVEASSARILAEAIQSQRL